MPAARSRSTAGTLDGLEGVLKLAVFDLDGTLTDTNAVDTSCYVAAWRDVHNVDFSTISWASFENLSDSAITKALCAAHLDPTECERAYQSVKSGFLRLLTRAVSEAPDSFRAVLGAPEALRFLASRKWGVSIATGAWPESASIKLSAAGFPPFIPVSSCGQHDSRSEIVRNAVGLAADKYATRFDRIVLVGDAPWDVATAAELRLPFVGRAAGLDRHKLQAAGANAVLTDFADVEALEHALVTAAVPR